MGRLRRWRPSELEKLELCPCYKGSSVDTAVSAEGTMLHAVMEAWVSTGEVSPELRTQMTEEHWNLVKFCQNKVADLVEGSSRVQVEKSFKIYHQGNIRIRGTADLVVEYDDDRPPVVVDYKFGRLPVTPADSNLQGLAYILGFLRQAVNCPEAKVMFIHPHSGECSEHLVSYHDTADIITRIAAVISKCHNYNDPTPHPVACQYCAEKRVCIPVGKRAVAVVEAYGGLAIPTQFLPGPDTTDEQRNVTQHMAGILAEWGKLWKQSNTEAAIEDGAELEDFNLRSRSGSRKIVDTVAAWRILSDLGVAVEEFLACCKITVGDLDQVLERVEQKGEIARLKDRAINALEESGVMTTSNPSIFLQRKPKASLEAYLNKQLTE